MMVDLWIYRLTFQWVMKRGEKKSLLFWLLNKNGDGYIEKLDMIDSW
jgi:hypothetical protein